MSSGHLQPPWPAAAGESIRLHFRLWTRKGRPNKQSGRLFVGPWLARRRANPFVSPFTNRLETPLSRQKIFSMLHLYHTSIYAMILWKECENLLNTPRYFRYAPEAENSGRNIPLPTDYILAAIRLPTQNDIPF